ncbi:hypothetical protein QAD02_011237 [Eretmocerus hayati]|uniref:Uncharacterized protein n=1 Tax=Eretmocerus hayati TaxID=131215 RepID=A0ACC2NXC0_9HYME|nr:hypothetical protein QAD02_011237 [Eretmocerus hayati]
MGVVREWFVLRDRDSFELFYCIDAACEFVATKSPDESFYHRLIIKDENCEDRYCKRVKIVDEGYKNVSTTNSVNNFYGRQIVGNFHCRTQNCSQIKIISQENYDHTGTNDVFFLRSDEQLNATIFLGENTKEIPHLVRDTYRRAGISTANGNFSFCQRDVKSDKNVFSCVSGYSKEWVNLTFDYEPQNFIMYGAVGGQYLVLTGKEGELAEGENLIPHTFYLTAFDARGIRRNSKEITTFKKELNNDKRDILHAHIYEDKGKEYCVNLYKIEDLVSHKKCFGIQELFA